jgi:hypothetical protein
MKFMMKAGEERILDMFTIIQFQIYFPDEDTENNFASFSYGCEK